MSGAAPGTVERRLARRRLVSAVVAMALPVTLVLGFGHRGVHAARSLLFPGAGLVDERPVLAAALALAGVAATVGWLRWGLDWVFAAVALVALALSFALPPSEHVAAAVAPVLPPAPAAHEFPLVILVVTALGWVRVALRRLPGARALAARRAARRVRLGLADVERLGPVDRSRCAALVALAGLDDDVARAAAAAGTDDGVTRRARRIGLVTRWRRGDPFAVDHAPARAALALTGRLDGPSLDRFAADARRSAAGVPASEPGWVRPLDGTLAALALVRIGAPEAGARWTVMLDGPLARRRSHRPAWWWTPLGVGAGMAPAWEHAAATGLARAAGWVDDGDWAALRARALGAAARGTAVPDDERLVAAARLWLVFVDDDAARRILSRPTVRHDPIAVALDAVARRLAADPAAWRVPAGAADHAGERVPGGTADVAG